MSWYIFILVTIGLLTIATIMAELKNKSINNAIMPLAFIVLAFFMAFRASSVGADTKQYVFIYRQICDISLSNIFTNPIYGYGWGYTFRLERGYILFNKLVSYISHNDQTITIATSLLLLMLLFLMLRKRSTYPMLSIWLYITLGIFQTNMNMMRNAIVIFWCYYNLHLIEEHHLVKYLISMTIAFLFHKSAILFIPLYWIVNKVEFTPKVFLMFLIISIILGFAFNFIRPFVAQILPNRFARYLTSDSEELEGLLVGLFHLLLIAFVFVLTKRKKWNDMVRLDRTGIWMLLGEVFFFAIGFNARYGTRMAALFGPYIIVLIPNLIGRGFQTKGNKMVTVATIMALTGTQYIMRLFINNIGSTMPYQFFWG